MGARFCIGTVVDARKGIALLEVSLISIDVLLDFVSCQEDQDGEDYRTHMRPLRFAVMEGPGDPDHLSLWADAKGWSSSAVVEALELGIFLLERHGPAWKGDPDWLPAGIDPATLMGLLQAAVASIRDSDPPELLTWVQH